MMVSTINGRITKGTTSVDIQEWASGEDQELFYGTLKKQKLVVMGSKTYDAARDFMEFRPGQLRVVMTRTPKRYGKHVRPGQLEFTSATAQKLVEEYAKKGYTQLFLVGGGEINALFFKAKLIDEILLTIEPFIFGNGKSLIAEGSFEEKFKLASVKKLNKRGTLLLKYVR